MKHYSSINYDVLSNVCTFASSPDGHSIKHEDFETKERLKSWHDILVSLWTIELKRRRLKDRILPEEKIDTEADPDISISKEFVQQVQQNLGMDFHKLGSLIEKLMEKNSQDADYYQSQKWKA